LAVGHDERGVGGVDAVELFLGRVPAVDLVTKLREQEEGGFCARGAGVRDRGPTVVVLTVRGEEGDDRDQNKGCAGEPEKEALVGVQAAPPEAAALSRRSS